MSGRLMAGYNTNIKPLLDLIEKRFSVCIRPSDAPEHFQSVHEHYQRKREFLLQRLGEAGALSDPAYAKAVMISEAARMILKEIMPKPRKKKSKSIRTKT